MPIPSSYLGTLDTGGRYSTGGPSTSVVYASPGIREGPPPPPVADGAENTSPAPFPRASVATVEKSAAFATKFRTAMAKLNLSAWFDKRSAQNSEVGHHAQRVHALVQVRGVAREQRREHLGERARGDAERKLREVEQRVRRQR